MTNNKPNKYGEIMDNMKFISVVVSLILSVGFYIFMAGKLTESINQNTKAIQANTAQITKNAEDNRNTDKKQEEDITKLKEYKASSEEKLDNICEDVKEIKIDIKELLKNKNE